MMLRVPQVLSEQQLAEFRQVLMQARWLDGRETAGHHAVRVKDNLQLPLDSPESKLLGKVILQALERHALFISAALPHRILTPRFNCYRGGQAYGLHVDNALTHEPGGERIRTDLSATLFLSAPGEYEGGELMVEDTYGSHSVKLAAGDLILYPASSLHQVLPVTQGMRLAAFFWIQSMVRDDGERTLLFQLDNSAQQLVREQGEGSAVATQLGGIYHNLLRRWAEV